MGVAISNCLCFFPLFSRTEEPRLSAAETSGAVLAMGIVGVRRRMLSSFVLLLCLLRCASEEQAEWLGAPDLHSGVSHPPVTTADRLQAAARHAARRAADDGGTHSPMPLHVRRRPGPECFLILTRTTLTTDAQPPRSVAWRH